MARQFKPGQLQTGSLYNISASYALTASYAMNGGGGGGSVNTSSLLITASAVDNTITFTKGDGSTFPVTVNTGSGGGGGTPGGLDTQIQFNSASTFSGSSALTFNYPSQSLQQGNNVIASGLYSHAEGSSTQTIGVASHAEGNLAKAIGEYSHAEGDNTQAKGDYSHAEGQETISSGSYSHAEGYSTLAQGDRSHAEGDNTQAKGDYSHAEGRSTTATGIASHAEGYYTVASGSYQHVQGQYNISSSAQSAFIIGNGVDDSNRSNLVFASGSTFQVTGSVIVSGSITGSLFGTASWAENFNTSSIQTQVDSLTSGTSSYMLITNTASMLQPYVLIASTSSMLQPYVLTTSTASMLLPYVLTTNTASMLQPYVLTSVTSSMLQPYVLTLTTSSMLQPYVLTSSTASMTVLSSSFANTASYVASANVVGPYGANSITSASYAVTASYAQRANSVNELDQNVVISGSLTVVGASTFFGTSSFVAVTASQLYISQSYISVNVFEPVQRFGGLYVYDSGSSAATASLTWDSLHNHWVYTNASDSTYSGGMLMSGPRHTGSLGDEPSLTRWFVARSDGGDHLNDTQIFSSASIHQVTGSLTVTAGVTASLLGNVTGSVFGTASWAERVDTGSIQTQVNTLIAATSSYMLIANTSSMLQPYVLTASTASMTVLSSSFATTAAFAETVTRYTRWHVYDSVTSASIGKTYDYNGYAVAGTALTDNAWTITRLVITASGAVVARDTANITNWYATGSAFTYPQ
jgi:hypothetical protein